jgi:hypothetical protein
MVPLRCGDNNHNASSNNGHDAWQDAAGSTRSREAKSVQQAGAIRSGDHVPGSKILHR